MAHKGYSGNMIHTGVFSSFENAAKLLVFLGRLLDWEVMSFVYLQLPLEILISWSCKTAEHALPI